MIDIQKLKDLVTSEYSEKPNFMSLLSLLLTPVQNVADLNHNMSIMMDVNTATGKTLDLIGQIVGVSRQLNFQPSGGISSLLDDDYYRIVIKAKIAKNQWDGTKEGLYTIWENLFPSNPVLIVDGQNMTCSVVVVGLNDSLSRELILADYIVPRPAGVKYNFGFTDNPIYSQDLDTDYLKGFDLGYWLDLTGGIE